MSHGASYDSHVRLLTAPRPAVLLLSAFALLRGYTAHWASPCLIAWL